MCGISGFWGDTDVEEALRLRITSMADRLSHRGPDGSGYWISPTDGFALGHRRLAVVDLSPAGRQPMVSTCGRWVLVFNGEIYNHADLRRELDRCGRPIHWRGHSDTEVLLEAIVKWGCIRSLPKLRGMFAFAVWDREAKRLFLARDRLGEKPLYYGWQQKSFMFASEPSAFHAHPHFEGRISSVAVSLFLRHCYVPTPYSIYEDIYKLPPGSFLEIDFAEQRVMPRSYWSLVDAVVYGDASPIADESDALQALEPVLSEIVRAELEADVPVGILLSGGVDSLAVTTLAQEMCPTKINTFTVGVDDRDYDESASAREVANHLGTRHTELRIRACDALKAVEEMASIYSEPFADSSQLPTFLIMRKVREYCTVALSGDGGDELFGGYQRYHAVPLVWNIIGRIPKPLRPHLGKILAGLAAQDRIGMLRALGKLARQPQLQRKLQKLGRRVCHAESFDGLCIDFQTEWTDEENPAGSVPNAEYLLANPRAWIRTGDPVRDMMALDTRAYLPDDILVKVDRASMASSLETRAPFLDHKLIELAWRIPRTLHFKDGRGKYLLRKLLSKRLPSVLLDRPKMGFGIPIDQWLRGPLKSWATDLLANESINATGLMDPANVSSAWQAHQRDGVNYGNQLWAVLMLQSWLRYTGRSGSV